MSNVTPLQVLKDVAMAVPEDCRSNIVVIGSLAAGYHAYRQAIFYRTLIARPGYRPSPHGTRFRIGGLPDAVEFAAAQRISQAFEFWRRE